MEPSTISESKWEKERKARQAAMIKRLKSLPKDNAIVKLAIKRKSADMNYQETDQKFGIIEELVSAARKQVTDGEDYNDTISDLGEAICSLVDNGKKKADDDSDE